MSHLICQYFPSSTFSSMLKLFSQITNRSYVGTFRRNLQTTKPARKRHCCKVLVVGGGNGGATVAARFARTMCKNEIIIVEPADIHYYQSMFTLIGAGVHKLRDSCRPMLQVLPVNATWFKDEVEAFCPKSNLVKTKKGESIEYDVLVISVGVKLDLEQICGLPEALENYGDVSTIYSPQYAEKTFKTIRRFAAGNAIFTHPKTAVKCPGATQKICYLAEHYFRKDDKRCDTNIIYAMGQHCLFPIKRYEAALWKVVEKRNIDVHLHTNLIEVRPDKRQAVFECLKKPGNKICLEYSLLHVTPPMSPPDALKRCKDLVDDEGYVAVHRNTLRHNTFPNVYALGDCSSAPNSKTSSAVFPQSFVVYSNAKACLEGKDNTVNYSGYAACPIITGYGTCVLAEFDYSLQPKESFPFRQDVESYFFYFVKKDIMPILYWKYGVTGLWDGPEKFHKFLYFKR